MSVTTVNSPVVVGVDGGGTRLRAAVVSVDGELLGAGESGAGNFHDVGARQVRDNIGAAVRAAWADAGQSPRRAEAIFLGLGSVVTSEDRATIREVVQELAIAPHDAIGVDHDLRVALAGGLAGEAGIVLIAGTGSSCYGRDSYGHSWLSGGCGPTLDDPGSAFWLGRQAMVAAVRAFDGRGEPTTLHDAVVEAIGIADMRHILRRVELEGMTRAEVAGLARLVTQESARGDRVARSLLAEGARELALMVAAVAKKLDHAEPLDRIPVVVTGGLTSAGVVFLDPVESAVNAAHPKTRVQRARLSPVLGAALLAMEQLGEKPAAAVVQRLVGGYSATQPALA